MTEQQKDQPLLPLTILEVKVRQFTHVTETLAACAHDFNSNRGLKAKTYINPSEESFEVTSRHGLTGLWEVRQALYSEIVVHGFGAQLKMIEQEAAVRYGLTND